MPNETGELMSMTRAASRLGISPRKLRRYIDAGAVSPFMLDPDSGRPLFSIQDLDAFFRRRGELRAERGAA